MAEFGGETNLTGAFGEVDLENFGEEGVNVPNNENIIGNNEENCGTIRNTNLPVTNGFWQKFKNFWLQDIEWDREIKVVLTPAQQKVEDEINAFLHQEVTWGKIHDFLFQEIKFGKKD